MPLLLIGGGGHCKSVISAAQNGRVKIRGIIDVPYKVGRKLLGVPIIGSDADLKRYAGKCKAVITLGSVKDNGPRKKLFERAAAAGLDFGTVASKRALINKNAVIGRGTAVLDGVIINVDAEIGENCIINTGAIVEHDCRIGNHCHVAPGALLGGGVHVADEVFIGSGAVVRQGTRIGKAAVVGAGAVVVRDVEAGAVVAGNPARPLHHKAE